MENKNFSSVLWVEGKLHSNSWRSASTSSCDESDAWRSALTKVYAHKNAKVRRSGTNEFFDSVQVTSSVTHYEHLPATHDGSLSDYESARNLLYHWEHHKRGRVASVYVVFFIEHNFSEMNLQAVNSLLLSVSPDRLTEWSMIALLRASYSAKHLLPGWSHFMDAVKEELRGNERAERLLFGLQD
ncbi:hypothetical protein [Pseudomonas syringae]|uniref:hypothetical protein n=1 Tax=Pseudomonas syringae TaxID=317 RepID=UPI0018E5E467|nr:hypothetical protein [Pseudomonas syringae]MBI6794657.1 hypothetical protein [Pseudomonas syringae]